MSINVFQSSTVLQAPDRAGPWRESHRRGWWKSAFRGPERETNRFELKYDGNMTLEVTS